MLSNASRMYIATWCSPGRFDMLQRYIMATHRHVFGVIEYTSFMALFTSVVCIIATFYWSYADVFIMLVSIALASRFRLLNYHLKQVKGKASNNSVTQLSIFSCYSNYHLKEAKETGCDNSFPLIFLCTDF